MTPQLRREPTPGRNDPCFCNSSKKYKHCHGAMTRTSAPPPQAALPDGARLAFARKEAHERRRELIQGKGRPILSADVGTQKAVVVGNEILFFRNCRTFPDFLFSYLHGLLGRDWWFEQTKRPVADWHPMMRWHEAVAQQQATAGLQTEASILSIPMSVAAHMLLHLAYDLYTLAHNVDVRDTLLARLKHPEQFRGARYETYVAASLIRAGFAITFENEGDRSTSHCEFTALHQPTGQSFSVEAKHRDRDPPPTMRTGRRVIGNRLSKALKKVAAHERIIFLDAAVEAITPNQLPTEFENILGYLRRYEQQAPTTTAYIFVTSTQSEASLDSTDCRIVIMQDSFNISDARLHTTVRTIGEALTIRTRHQAVSDLMSAMRTYQEVPSTFDGTFSELTFDADAPRLLIGERYLVPDEDGSTVVGVLESATVSESEATAYGVYRLADGRALIRTAPLSEREIRAYRKQPDTFFDVIQTVGTNSAPEDLLAKYDFLMSSYGKASKSTLLRLMRDAPSHDVLCALDQPALAHIYCTQMAHNMVDSYRRHEAEKRRAQTAQPPTPPPTR